MRHRRIKKMIPRTHNSIHMASQTPLGGRTGRDGVGGATGSSKEHDASSIEICGAEVQKGNAPEEHKILLQHPELFFSVAVFCLLSNRPLAF